LKVTNTDTAIGRYQIGQTPFSKEEKLSFFEDTTNGPTNNHNIATTKTSLRLWQLRLGRL